MASVSELAHIYSALILHDDEVMVTEDKISHIKHRGGILHIRVEIFVQFVLGYSQKRGILIYVLPKEKEVEWKSIAVCSLKIQSIKRNSPPPPCPSLLLPAQHQDSSGRGQSHLRLSTPILLQKRLLDPPEAQQGHFQCIFYLYSERNINTKGLE